MTTDITAPLLLRSDVLLVPVSELDEQVRGAIECEDDDVALTRPRSRTTSTVVDATAAQVIEYFREPRTIVEAVILFGRRQGVAPQAVLGDTYALIQRLLQSGFLLPADGPQEDPAESGPSLGPSDVLDGVRVVRPVYMLEDTELYLVRDEADRYLALKIQRPGSDIGALLRREADALRALAGGISPRLDREAEVDGRPYLLMEWCSGIDAESAALECRAPTDRPRMLALLREIARAYAELHGRGLLHGDVHPRNILVDAGGRARLIDFGFARPTDPTGAPRASGSGRGGIPFFYEPELALAGLEGRPPPASTESGEQYAVGALLYFLVTGTHYADFSMAREPMLREVLEAPPTPLVDRGVEPWPELESVLFRALAKDPAARFPSMLAFADAIAALERHPGEGPPALAPLSTLSSTAEELLAAVALDRELFARGLERAPVASVNYGAAGIAYGLYRTALARGDAGLLALADAWCRRAEAVASEERAFTNTELEITPATVGAAAPLHARSGVAAVRAFLGRAMADGRMVSDGVADFVGSSASGHKDLDLALGRSATVLGAAFLLDSLPFDQPGDALLRLGRGNLAAVWEQIDGMPVIGEGRLTNLGIAHGWAGLLYATLQWHRASGDPLPGGTEARLLQLARAAYPAGRGMAWKWSLEEQAPSMPGWCNGTAGHVALWSLAHRVLGDPRHRSLAVAGAWDVWDAADLPGSLCCGLIGRAYALLNVHRLTGDSIWLSRARTLGERAARHGQFEEEFPFSLYKGRWALAVLAADLDRPDDAAHPFFEEERWPRGGAEPAQVRITLRHPA